MEQVSKGQIVKQTLTNVSNCESVVVNVAFVSTRAALIGKNVFSCLKCNHFLTRPFHDFSCKCGDFGVCGRNCHLPDPCVHDVCANGGTCIENCSEVADYYCNCTSQFTGKNCTEEVSDLRARILFFLFRISKPVSLCLSFSLVLAG